MVTQCDPELTLLTITNLDLSYPGDEPLATISWQVERGDQIALLGRSGTGKSTLLAAIIEGSPAIIKESERIAYLSQQPALLPWATVIENVLLGFKLRGDTQSSDTTEKALNLLGQVELGTHAHRQVALLSGGQKPESPLHAYYSNNQIWYYWMNRSRVSIARHASKWLHSVRHYLPAKQSF